MADNALAQLSTLFADVVGSTRLYERFGDEAAHAAIEECLDRLKRITAEFDGRTVKTIGDELMAVFPDAQRACMAATEMQWQVQELPPIEDHRIELRIAFHHGSAVERDGDVFGDSVNVAARLSELAKGRQIITSAPTLAVCGTELAAAARHLWPVEVRGKSAPVDLYEILWDAADATVTLSAQWPAAKVARRLRLVYCGHELAIDAGCAQVSIGRDAGNEVVVDAPNASRVHARIEWRRDKFVLIDVSTNGTFVGFEDGRETALRHEELILDGQGSISLGSSHRKGRRSCVEYYCEYGMASGRFPETDQPGARSEAERQAGPALRKNPSPIG
jgi:class 3 adenylate cyclase